VLDVASDADILSQEIFAPVAPVASFDDVDGVVAAANERRAGLIAYVVSGDLGRALRLGEAIEAGMIAVDRGLISDPAAPFGGVKGSGLGREGGHEGIEEYLERKYIRADW
jgi:succinate-semialdehyde dehydrogenase/glutarate-semialdehyde dehydrogenase